jgi:hypothetical protein
VFSVFRQDCVVGGLRYSFSSLDFRIILQANFSIHVQGTRPEPQGHSDEGKIAGIFCFLVYGWCNMWVEGRTGQGSVVHFCDVSI